MTRGTKLERTIRELLANRDDDSTICPSEVARAVGGTEWRALMPEVRDAARRLVQRGELVVTQKGRVVDLDGARGPIRLRRAT